MKFSRVRTPELRTAIGHALGEPAYRQAAARVQASFAAAGGAPAAADALEHLVP